MEQKKSYDCLVLPGGGVKGFYILGGIQALIDLGLLDNIKTYVGTSIGSILSYLLAIGYTPIEIMVSVYLNKWLEKMQHFNLVAMINGSGALSFSALQDALEKLTINKIGRFLTLEKLRQDYGKTLVCTTYNMTTCTTEYLGPDNYPDLPCLTALRMSCNIPLIFERFRYMDNFYIDGGISDNFPILKGEQLGEKIIGINLEIPENSLKDEPEDGIARYFLKLLQIPMIQGIKHKISMAGQKCTIATIKSGALKNMVEFDVKSKVRLDMFSEGYTQVRDFVEGKDVEKEPKTN